MRTPSRRATVAATSTAACLGVLAAVALGSATDSQAGKTTAVAPIVKTRIETTKRTVHVKNPKTIKVTRSSGSGSTAGAVVVASATEQVAAGTSRSAESEAEDSASQSQRASSFEPEGAQEDAGHDAAEREYEDSHEQEDGGWEGDD